VLILITGNYTFFNLLTIALTLFLFDDQALARFVPAPVTERLQEAPRATGRARVAAFVAVIVMVLSLSHLFETFNGQLPSFLKTAVRYTAPLQIVNNGTGDLLVYAYGYPPEDEHAEFLESAI